MSSGTLQPWFFCSWSAGKMTLKWLVDISEEQYRTAKSSLQSKLYFCYTIWLTSFCFMSSLAMRNRTLATQFLVSEVLLLLQAAGGAVMHWIRCILSVQWLLQVFCKTILPNKACSMVCDSITVVDWIILRTLVTFCNEKKSLINVKIWLTQCNFLLNCIGWVRVHHWWIANYNKIFLLI